MSQGDLLGAGVGGDDCTEVRRQPEGCLPVPSGAVPGEVVGGDERVEVGKEGIGVRGAVCLVTVCVVGEMVGESHQGDPEPELIVTVAFG